MLRDKDIAAVVEALKAAVNHWFLAGLGGARGAGVAELERTIRQAGVSAISACADVQAAYAQACDMATENDRIVVFGSFYTVAAVMQVRASRAGE
jgi:dihydrofolate synthase/folylpolyglutamate synthase